MNILIATQNSDKFQIIKGLLSGCGLSDCSFKNLSDVHIESQPEEHGDSINRALMKAQYAYREIGGEEQIDIYVGADDRMECKNCNANDSSQVTTEKILRRQLLDAGDTLTIVRAFALLDREGAVIDKFETEIPYRFTGNPDNFQFLDNKYPLNYVLSALEGGKSLVEMGEEEAMNYYLRFSGERIKEAIGRIAGRV